jgi:hypothetical protein
VMFPLIFQSGKMPSPMGAKKEKGKKEISPQFSQANKIFLAKPNRKHFFCQKVATPPRGAITGGSGPPMRAAKRCTPRCGGHSEELEVKTFL